MNLFFWVSNTIPLFWWVSFDLNSCMGKDVRRVDFVSHAILLTSYAYVILTTTTSLVNVHGKTTIFFLVRTLA